MFKNNIKERKERFYAESLASRIINEIAKTLLSNNGRGSLVDKVCRQDGKDQSTREIAGKRNLSERWRRLKFVPGSDYGITGLRYSGGGQRGSGSGKD